MNRFRWFRPGFAAAVAGALVVGLIATAVVFSIARRTSNAADVGTEALYEEASLSAAAASRNRIVQAQLIARAESFGVSTPDEVAKSLDGATEALLELERRLELLQLELDDPAERQRFDQLGREFLEHAEATLFLIRFDQLDTAEEAIEAALDDSYQALAGELAVARDEAIAVLAVTKDTSGRLGDAASFLVALLLPVSVFLVYRSRVQNQQRRKNLESSLEKQQAVARTKDEFIANLSHELRTPLTGIYGFALELIGGEHDPSTSIELARLIAGQSAELSRMVEDLLTLATMEHNELVVDIQLLNPVAVVADVLEPLRATGVLAVDQSEDGLIRADSMRLRQIIRNLVSNAHRHGGPHVRVVGREDGTNYTIEVRDNGRGVPEELESKLFTRFIHEGTTPLIKGSVGLGLSIAALLADRMGGEISYRRDQGETVFAVQFPAVKERVQAPLSIADVHSAFTENLDPVA